jgi:hypothetical protein
MLMTARVRKFMLTMHVASSAGWFGAVASFLGLAIVGLVSPDGPKARAAYLAMESITDLAIVPFCLASFATGVLQSLGTTWGLFRHYWVLLKLLMTVVSTVILLMHTQPIRYAASIAAETASFNADFGRLRIQLAADASAALLVLLVTTALGIYKPRGMTAYGQRKQNERRHGVVPSANS